MLDFLFLNSPSNKDSPHPPYHYLWLAAWLEARGFKCQIRDPHPTRDLPDARFTCVAAYHSDYPWTSRIASAVRSHHPDTKMVVGNVHPTLNP